MKKNKEGVDKCNVVYYHNSIMDCEYRLHTQVYRDENGINESIIYRYSESGLLLLKTTISGDITKEIDEEKLTYGENELLCRSENNKYVINYEYDEFDNLKKLILFNKKRNSGDYWLYEYKEKQKIKQIKYSPENIMKYEISFEYDKKDRRVMVFRDNEYFGHREYDDYGLLKKYHMKDGRIVYFIWENRSSNYDWNMFYGF